MRLNEALRKFEKTGLGTNPEETIIITDEPKYPQYLVFSGENDKEKYRTNEVHGQGISKNSQSAKVKAYGEYLERLAIENPQKEYLSKPRKFNPGKDVRPSLFRNYSSEQINIEEFENKADNEIYRWYPAKNLSTGEEVNLPAQLIYINPEFNKEFPIRLERITTGTALGFKGTGRARKEGLLESIERDSCIGAYLQAKELPLIENLPKNIEKTKEYLERYQLEPYVFDATSDLEIPTALTVTVDKSNMGQAINVGSDADLNYKDAIERSIMESIQCRRTGRILKEIECPERLPKENEINSLDNRFFYWFGNERKNDLPFWLGSTKKINYKKLNKKPIGIDEIVNSLDKRGFHVFEADISLPEMEKEGIEVKKVIIPELHPLYLDENAKYLYSKHYGEIKEKNLKPHPMT
ncbi:MAG: YcaO-like family protein [Candidatus Pacearchaeota archaeon]